MYRALCSVEACAGRPVSFKFCSLCSFMQRLVESGHFKSSLARLDAVYGTGEGRYFYKALFCIFTYRAVVAMSRFLSTFS